MNKNVLFGLLFLPVAVIIWLVLQLFGVLPIYTCSIVQEIPSKFELACLILLLSVITAFGWYDYFKMRRIESLL